MKRTRLKKSVWKAMNPRQIRLKPIHWEVTYGVYDRVDNSFKFTGQTAKVLAKGKSVEEAVKDATTKLDNVYTSYRYGYQIRKVEEL